MKQEGERQLTRRRQDDSNRVEKTPESLVARCVDTVKEMLEDTLPHQICKAKGQSRSENEPLPPHKPRVAQHSHTARDNVCEQECGDTSKNGCRNGQKDAGEFAEDTKEDEEETTPSSSCSVGAASDGDHTVVLSKGREGCDSEEGGHESTDTVSEDTTLDSRIKGVACDGLARDFCRCCDITNGFHRKGDCGDLSGYCGADG